MVVVYIKRNGKRDVATLEPKRDAWRKAKMNIIASYKSWHEFRQSGLYLDMKSYQHR